MRDILSQAIIDAAADLKPAAPEGGSAVSERIPDEAIEFVELLSEATDMCLGDCLGDLAEDMRAGTPRERSLRAAAVIENFAATPSSHRPHRDDAVAVWLKRHRDEHSREDSQWWSLDDLLDEYRLHADTGTPLDQHACSHGNCCDGEKP